MVQAGAAEQGSHKRQWCGGHQSAVVDLCRGAVPLRGRQDIHEGNRGLEVLMLSLTSQDSCFMLKPFEHTCFVLSQDWGTTLWKAAAAHVSDYNANA